MLTDLVAFLPLAILTNTAFPFPFDYVLIYFAEDYPPERMWIFAALGSVSAALGGSLDVKLLTVVGRWRRSKTWNVHRVWFYALVFVCALLPVPYVLIRLVLLKGSPHVGIYAATVGAARFPRYLITVHAWQLLSLPSWASGVLVASALPWAMWHLLRPAEKVAPAPQEGAG